MLVLSIHSCGFWGAGGLLTDCRTSAAKDAKDVGTAGNLSGWKVRESENGFNRWVVGGAQHLPEHSPWPVAASRLISANTCVRLLEKKTLTYRTVKAFIS